ncbi:MAG TPA: A24 family peptidase [Candidatus Acidoferrum sp.]|jgi:prepilin peptidase CpaA
MKAPQMIWALTILLTAVAAFVDFRTRKIPNWLTVPAFVAGLTLRTALLGWPGAKSALEGTGLALVLLLPLVLMRALGAGDWKLMGAVGACLGPLMFLFVLLGSILVSGIMAVVEMARTRKIRETFHNLYVLVQGFFSFGLRAHPQISLDNPELLKLPFGVAVAIATVGCYCAARWGL